MKLICLERKTIILLALIFRQFGLSVFRSGSNTKRVTEFFEQHHQYYQQLFEKLEHTVVVEYGKTKIVRGIQRRKTTGFIKNILINRNCFFKSDFEQIVHIYFFGFELLKTKQIEQNEEWMILGQELMGISNYLIDLKLSKSERKIVNRIEHFDQNQIFDGTSYSVEQALKVLCIN